MHMKKYYSKKEDWLFRNLSEDIPRPAATGMLLKFRANTLEQISLK
jgi:hypothetical protein